MTQSTWDEFIRKYAPHALFQSWAWGEVEKQLGHTVWRLTWPGAAAQVVKVEARRGTFLHVRHGPVVGKDWGRVMEDLKSLAKQEHAWFVRISPQVAAIPIAGLVPAPIHAMDAEVCWVLDLDPPQESLLSSMRKTTRYEIKHTRGVKIEKTNDMTRFMRLYEATSRRQEFTKHAGIRQEFETLDARLYVASYDGRDYAAAIIVDFNDEAIYHHGASIPSKVPASTLLQWHVISEAKKRGKKLYNFWGIAPFDNQNHPWRGLTAFKKGFGGREVRYIHAQDLPISPWYVIPKIVELVRKRYKGY